ncbi:hypothetical protein [Marinicellulosiphila megalodicopiae]|uniref:hypothetical protein n=1 Tax=Marinicellulosiphila megalodicopiae TaxID=2724896 RepID=UPI003BB09C12
MKNSRSQILDWAEKGLIEPHKLDDAMSLTGAKPSKLQWRSFLLQCLLWMGVCAIFLNP